MFTLRHRNFSFRNLSCEDNHTCSQKYIFKDVLELWFIKAKNGNKLNAIVIAMMVTMNRGTLNKN